MTFAYWHFMNEIANNFDLWQNLNLVALICITSTSLSILSLSLTFLEVFTRVTSRSKILTLAEAGTTVRGFYDGGSEYDRRTAIKIGRERSPSFRRGTLLTIASTIFRTSDSPLFAVSLSYCGGGSRVQILRSPECDLSARICFFFLGVSRTFRSSNRYATGCKILHWFPVTEPRDIIRNLFKGGIAIYYHPLHHGA